MNFRASQLSQGKLAIDDYASSDGEHRDSTTSNTDDGLEIAKLGISEEIITALSKKGITKLFPIQRAVLEPAMQGRDMVGRARTGTGKTLAFGIPILDKIIRFNEQHGRGRNPLCLVLAPTRELAKQVAREFTESAPKLDIICVYGGVPISQQMRELDYGIDVAVGTPGRIIDLLKRGSLVLSEVKFLVLDEADQMLQVGFKEEVDKILERVPKDRQNLLFSATMPAFIKEIIRNHLKKPLTIDLVGDSHQKLAEGIKLYSIASSSSGKASIIGPLIAKLANGGKCIVFTQTKRDADRLAHGMARSYSCEALHGDISQNERERTLTAFRNGKINILVATDVAARGLDIPNVDLVIHYELPNSSETFVHRTGRTGRAGKTGTAILVYTPDKARSVKGIERDVGCSFSELPSMEVQGEYIDMRSGSRSGMSGGSRDRRSGDTGFGRFGGQGESGFGRSGSGSGRFGSKPNRSADSGGSSFGRSGGFGEKKRSDRSSDFGSFGSSRSGQGRTSGFGGSSRSGRGRSSEF